MAKKFKFRHVNEIVGGFVLLVFLLLLAGVLVAGRAQHWFEGTAVIHLRLPQQEGWGEGFMGLQKGAEVIAVGTPVGSVQDLIVNEETGAISGTIRVRAPFMRYVRSDMVAWVRKKMVVTGDAYLELGPDKGPDGRDLPVLGEVIPAGGEIVVKKDVEIIQMLEEALKVLQMEAENTLRLVNAAIGEYTLVAENLNDSQAGLPPILSQANELMKDLRTGEGIPAKVLNDPAMADDLGNIVARTDALLAQMNAMADDLRKVSEKLPEMADTLSGEVDHLPVVIGESQTLIRETIVLLDGLQKHWFLRKYVESDDALRSGEVLVP
ncbi:MAG: MCE family protein [Lentisphaerae bacterium]|nr:MCE family protein [Lentisphaerota bacterium]